MKRIPLNMKHLIFTHYFYSLFIKWVERLPAIHSSHVEMYGSPKMYAFLLYLFIVCISPLMKVHYPVF